MKKLLILASLCTLFLCVPAQVAAEESLLDNELDLKTDRLNQEQTDKNPSQSVTVDDNLFNTEQMEKLKKGEAKQEQQRKKEIEQLFIGKTLTAKEFDVDDLFLPTTENQEAAGQTETAAVSTEPKKAPLLLPLLLIAAAISLFVMLFYYGKKEGKKMAENKEHINVTLLYEREQQATTDVRIPRNITVYRLIRELNQIFNKTEQIPKYQLKIKNKGLLLDEEKRLKDFPVTDGDIIEVLGE